MKLDDPASDKQKEKLKFFGCVLDEGITKGQASDALTECARQFPQREIEYYARPATEEQLEIIIPILAKDDEIPSDYAEGGFLTYGEAKQILSDCKYAEWEKQKEKEDALLKKEQIKYYRRHKRSKEIEKFESEAKQKLIQYDLGNVRINATKVAGNIVVLIDADSDSELLLAAQILGIKNGKYIP